MSTTGRSSMLDNVLVKPAMVVLACIRDVPVSLLMLNIIAPIVPLVPLAGPAPVGLAAMPPEAPPGTPILERVELEIWWMSGSRRHTLALEGFRQSRLAP